ncbi:MAG: substrate-binding domain-containing protein, partial [Ligilactobacillus sp.]|nr:substrate-binding domain-containing protein [Ligilactobacillus sp.]
VTGADLKNETLLLPKRGIVRNELKTWLKALPTSTNILGTSNLLGNVTTLARQSGVCLICVKGAFEMFDTSELVFILFALLRHSKHILAWRKNIELSLAAQEFIEFVKNNKL